MDGVELPCGSVMRVEPASSSSHGRSSEAYHATKTEEPNRCSRNDEEDGLTKNHDPGDVDEGDSRKDAAPGEDGDDLDAFFNSL
jgi:hypothetical protein